MRFVNQDSILIYPVNGPREEEHHVHANRDVVLPFK